MINVRNAIGFHAFGDWIMMPAKRVCRPGPGNFEGGTALKHDKFTKDGDSASRDVDRMIDQKPSKPGRAAEGMDEARLRQRAIGVKLRQMFDEVVNEPVPDEFLDILRRADSAKREER